MEHNTKEILANAQLPQGELCKYAPPQNPKFTLTPAELDSIMPEYLPGKRMRLRKSWTTIFRNHMQTVTPYTTWVFLDSAVCSQLKPRAPLFKAGGMCAASYCTAKLNCHANKDDKYTVHVKISGMSKLSTYNHCNIYQIHHSRSLHACRWAHFRPTERN